MLVYYIVYAMLHVYTMGKQKLKTLYIYIT